MQFPLPFGAYTLLSRLGHGGMAEVFLARKAGPGGFSKLVVIKRILPHLSREPEFVQMFLDEARLAARLEHPNVVQIFDMGQQDGAYFLAMEYLGGETVSGMARRAKNTNSPLGASISARVIAEACEGLHYAHEFKEIDGTPLGIVHRDASPQNIFVTYDGRVKVLDFGVAKVATKLAQTRTGTVKGKISYMSPEQCRGDPLDRRSDIFALGIVLFEMVAGRRMFKEDNEFSMLKKIGSGDFPRPIQLAVDAPRGLMAVCERAMAVDPKDRYATAREMHGEIESYLRSAQIEVGPEQVAEKMNALFSNDIEFRKQLLMATDDRAEIFQKLSEEASDSFPSLGSLAQSGARTAWARASTIHTPKPKRRLVRWAAPVAALVLGGAAAVVLWYPRAPAPPPSPSISPPSANTAPNPTQVETKAEPVKVEPAKSDPTKSDSKEEPAVGTVPTPKATLKPSPAFLNVTSQPSDCAVSIDGKLAGHTPVKHRRIEPNVKVTVAIDCAGHEPETRRIELSPGETSLIDVAPATKPMGTGFLTLKTTPWSVIFEGGTQLGMTPLSRVSLPAGKHTLRAVNEPQKMEKTLTVEIRPGETTSQSVDLAAP
jgi:eukaryotic-like serine/threonine-protein kinase